MPPQRVTLLQVAHRAGVSRTTASFVMTGRTDMRIAEETRERVLQAAHELNYRPNLMARGLRTRVTHTLALLSDTIATDQYAGQMINGGLAAALQHQHLLFVGETEGDRAVEAQLIEEFLDRQVDGFVYAAMYTQRARIPRELRGRPLVLLNCSAGRHLTAVIPDEIAAGRCAAQVVLDAGHEEAIYAVGERASHVFAGFERLRGIEEVLAAAGTGLAGTLDCAWWPQPAHEAVMSFLAGGGRATALICLNDRVALGAYQALQQAGLSIPDDVSVVSFDDSDLASWLRPQLTSVALPHYDLGRRAVELLLTGKTSAGIQRVPMPLRARGSVGPPRVRRSRTA